MQRLGKNLGKYLGETIDIHKVLAEIESAAQSHGWEIEVFLESEDQKLVALTRKSAKAEKHIYISTGIHGDEPAGPMAVLQLLKENNWPAGADIWLCPCLNPAGFTLNTRENPAGLDLNRQYLNTQAEEIRAHIAWLERQPSFDVCLCLHEDWESAGFYLYELNPDEGISYSKQIIERVSKVCPIDGSPMIEGREAANGIICPSLDPATRPQWPEAFYLITHKTRRSYTMEAPSDFPLDVRVAAHVTAVKVILNAIN
jgi:hypothetical protein